MKKFGVGILAALSTVAGVMCLLQEDHFLGMCIGTIGILGFLLCFFLGLAIEEAEVREAERRAERKRREEIIRQMDLQYVEWFDEEA